MGYGDSLVGGAYRASILVVDDEDSIRLLLDSELTDQGYQVDTAPTGEAALALAQRHAYDIVLTDIRMAGMGGLELTRALRRIQHGADVILMTGYASMDTAAEGFRAGAFDYLLKPFGELDLLEASVERALNKRRLERQAELLGRQVAHADRLASIGHLSAGVAHEINNPASFVLGNSTLMGEHIEALQSWVSEVVSATSQLPQGDAVRARLEAAFAGGSLIARTDELVQMNAENQAGIRRIASIVRDLRSFARSETRREHAPVCVDDVVRSAANMVTGTVRHRGRLVLDLDAPDPVMADSGRLTQVLVNLLVNASDALRDDSPRSNRISVSTRGAREGVTIVVEDTGCGVDPAVQERMFEPFYSTKRDGLGTGLGLSITADIVSEHRGRISIESEVGAGTRIEVSLPYQQGAMTSPPPTVETHQASACRSGVRVLLVDDEPLNLSVLGRILGRSHDVVTAGGGADALAIIEADTEIDVVVCDLMMAGVDGAAVYEAIAARRPDLADRVLVITAGATSNRTRAFVEAHADQVMYKPLEAPRLLAAIDALVAGEPPQP